MDETKGGIPARIGKKFYDEIERIKKERLLNNKSNKIVSTEKITNLIVRHKESWEIIFNDIINIEDKDLERLGR